MEKVFRVLSSGLLVSSAEFAKLGASKQTEVLTSAVGKPIVFVTNFMELRNKKRIIDRLLAGEDVALELEFNELDLTADEISAVKAVRPVLEKIRGATFGSYTFVTPNSIEQAKIDGIKFPASDRGNIRNSSGYGISKSAAKKIWDLASAWWSGGDKPRPYSATVSGYYRNVKFNESTNPFGYSDNRYIEVGCQNVSRAEIEHVAQYYGWEPTVSN